MDVYKLGFYSKEGHILKQVSVCSLSEPRKRTSLFDGCDSLPAAAAVDQLGRPLKNSKGKEEQSRDISSVFLHAAQQCSWSVVVTLVGIGVDVDDRDSVHVHPEQWDSFSKTVRCGLRQRVSEAGQQRIREFALEKAVAGSHEAYIVQMLSEQKLSNSTLQQLARRIVGGSAELALSLLKQLRHPNFTEHLWNQAIQQRRWVLLQNHVCYLLENKGVEISGDQLNKIQMYIKQIHNTICAVEGPLRAHNRKRCLVYEGAILYYIQHIFTQLCKPDIWKTRSAFMLQDNFSSLLQNCKNTEFLLDFFDQSLEKAAQNDLLYSFLLDKLPSDLVDASKKTSCDVVLKMLNGAMKPRYNIRKSTTNWLCKSMNDPKAFSKLIDAIFEKEDAGDQLSILMTIVKGDKHKVVQFVWLCHRALLQHRSSWADFAPVMNKSLKHFPMGTESPLILILNNLSQTAFSDQSDLSNQDQSSTAEPVSFSSSDIVWSPWDRMLVTFCAPPLVGWCKERKYDNLVFFLAFVMWHARCRINWRALLETPGVVCESLLFEGVNYAALDGDSASAASMLRRCKWDSVTVLAGLQVLQPLFLKENDKHLSSLTTACKYGRALKWFSVFKYKQLVRDKLWRKVIDFISRLTPIDPVLFGEVCREAVDSDQWEVFVHVVRNRCVVMQSQAQKLNRVMNYSLKNALVKGYVEGAAAALKLLDPSKVPDARPETHLINAMSSLRCLEMTRLLIAAGASVVHRQAEANRPRRYFCAMSLALITSSMDLIALLHQSGACSNARLFELDSWITRNRGRLHSRLVAQDCQRYLKSAATNPLRLDLLAGFSLSESVGVHPGRSRRIERLFQPKGSFCPQIIKRCMFYFDF